MFESAVRQKGRRVVRERLKSFAENVCARASLLGNPVRNVKSVESRIEVDDADVGDHEGCELRSLDGRRHSSTGERSRIWGVVVSQNKERRDAAECANRIKAQFGVGAGGQARRR